MSAGNTGACHPDRPLIMTTNPHCLIRQRRSLYEALLQLEQQNAVVIERDLPYVDLVLSPSACLCIWTEEQLLQASPHAFKGSLTGSMLSTVMKLSRWGSLQSCHSENC